MKKLAFAFWLAFAAPVFAANVNIDGLPTGTVAGADLVEIEQGGVNKQSSAGAVGNAGALTGDVTKSAGSSATTLATGNAGNLNSGTLNAARMPALSGDCTTASGAVATTCNNPHPGYIANLFYAFSGQASTTATGNAVAANIIRCAYGFVPKAVTVSALGVHVITAVAAGNFQLALYTSTAAGPGSLIAATASGSTTSAADVSPALSANKQIGPGGTDGGRDVWICANVDTTAGTGSVNFNALNASSLLSAAYMGGTTVSNAVLNNNIVAAKTCSGAACQGGSSTFNTWPASLATSTWTDSTGSTQPAIVMKVFSFP